MNVARTRLDHINITKDAVWPVIDQFHYEFIALKQTVITSFKAFLLASRGDFIKITDHESITRIGMIISPINEIVEPSAAGYKFDVSFTFQADATQIYNIMTESRDFQILLEGGSEILRESSP